MPKATATGLDANERSFDAVSESHQFFSFISFKSKVINENRWTKNYDQGSIKNQWPLERYSKIL